MKAVVAERGQVTIPKALRDRLGISPRTVLEFTEEEGRLVAVKANEQDPVTAVYACIRAQRPVDDLVAEMRDGE